MTTIEEIDQWLRPTVPAVPGDARDTMSWAIMLEVLWKFIEARTEAGWPWLIAFFERFWKRFEKDLNKITVGMADAVFAAPDALKNFLIDTLTGLRDNAGIVMKMFYSLLIQVVNNNIDKIWDSFFASGHAKAAFASFPAMVKATAPVSVDDMIEDADLAA